MKIDIVTPEGALFSGDIDAVVVPSINGSFEMLNNHAPIIAVLEKGQIRLKGKGILIDESVADKFIIEQDEVRLPINSGTVEMKNNKVIILAE